MNIYVRNLTRRKCSEARENDDERRARKQEGMMRRKKIQEKHSISQLFVAKPSQAILTFGALISLLMITTTIVIVNDNQQVEANLIGIYHKYRPFITKDHLLLNSSLFSQIDSHRRKGDFNSNPVSRSNEYNSPIKRIIELISQHAPVIVVSSGNSNNNNNRHPPQHHSSPQPQPQPPLPPPQAHHQIHYGLPHQPHLQSASNQLGASFLQSSPQASLIASSGGSSDRQHWTVLETGPPMGLQTLGDSQPQIIASSMPFDQFQHITEDNQGNQIALQVQQSQPLTFTSQSLGDNGQQQQHFQQFASGFPPDNSQQSPLFIQNQDQYHQHQHQQQQQQQQQLQTQEAQPIFLSSYVPEIPLSNGARATTNASPAGEQAESPDSIQDNIHANGPVEEQMAGKPEAQDSEGPSESSDEGDRETGSGKAAGRGALDESGENDIEEPQPQNNHQVEESGEPNNGDSGSITYEDKYDSDKDEPTRAHQSSPDSDSSTSGDGDSTRSEASGNIVNGLIKVGLTDDCLQCICRAASGCDQQLRCVTRGADEKYCGPFQLTEEYWNMAGSPGDASTNFSSFEDCANDIDCAVETVTNYMKKYYRDCDGDKYYTCTDYARLHRLKPDECGNTGKLVNGFDSYWAKFELCAEGYNRSRTGDDEEI